MFDSLLSLFSADIGVDLGTANTFVFVKGRGIIIREASVVVRNKKTKEILAIGEKAKKMIGKTPAMIEAIRPLHDGVISDYDATVAMLTYFFQQVNQNTPFSRRIFRPRVVLGIPS